MRDIWLKHSKIWLPVKSMSLLYSAFSLRLSSLEGRTWVVFRIPPSPWLWAISEASPAVPLPGAAFGSCIQGCCWTNCWVVRLFGLSCELYLFLFRSSMISANDNIFSFKQRVMSLLGGPWWSWWGRMRWLCLIPWGLATHSYLQFLGWITKVF